MPKAKLELDGISKNYGDLTAVDDISLTVEEGELLCLLGPSGCGKSTTLSMIAGLEVPTEGRVLVDGEDITKMPAYGRDSSIVFQSWALFPHKSVLDNVTFGLKMKGVPKETRIQQAEEMLEMVHLEEFANANPPELSGGQKQRTALARSLVVEPSILLLDEPLSNLDRQLREEMQIELATIQSQLEQTAVYVTHDQDEAFTLADRIGIINDGKLVQTGPPREVYANPKNEFVESFLGDTNFIIGTVKGVNPDHALTIKTPITSTITMERSSETEVRKDESVKISLRPEEIILSDQTVDDNDYLSFRGEIEGVIYRGSVVRYFLNVDGQELFFERRVGETDIEEGDTVYLYYEKSKVNCYAADGRKV